MSEKLVTYNTPMSRKRKFEAAKEDFQRMWEEIKPFIKKRTAKKHSTLGEWKSRT